MDELIEENGLVRSASLNAMAFHAPRMLDTEHRNLRARARSLARAGSTHPVDDEDLREEGRRIIEAIEQSGAFADAPPGLVS